MTIVESLTGLLPESAARRTRILYVSVHQILEYDELQIFDAIGCDVFTLGTFFGGTSSELSRPMPPIAAMSDEWTRRFSELGGQYRYGAPVSEMVIPRDFVRMFDVVVVMHDFDFIDTHWSSLADTHIIWRSIGVGTQVFEPRVTSLRERGVKVVRYCPTEARADGYAGHDTLIRFGKSEPAGTWTGGRPEILTFSNAYRQRFAREVDFYTTATSSFETVLGGAYNDLPGAVGMVSHSEQLNLFRQCATYFYASGSFIPYTLNFMEAWLTGIPVVAINCHAVWPEETCKFAEIPELIQHGQNGFLVDTPEQAVEVFHTLLEDKALAGRISERAVADASKLFSADVVKPQWRAFLDSIL